MPQHVHTLLVGGIGLHEEKVLADGAGEKLGILRDEANASAEAVDIDFVLGNPVVMDMARLRAIQANEQLHERGFACAGWPHEGDRLAARHAE